jgi:hypothetical protein
MKSGSSTDPRRTVQIESGIPARALSSRVVANRLGIVVEGFDAIGAERAWAASENRPDPQPMSRNVEAAQVLDLEEFPEGGHGVSDALLV